MSEFIKWISRPNHANSLNTHNFDNNFITVCIGELYSLFGNGTDINEAHNMAGHTRLGCGNTTDLVPYFYGLAQYK